MPAYAFNVHQPFFAYAIWKAPLVTASCPEPTRASHEAGE
jgi:hypothetical protein